MCGGVINLAFKDLGHRISVFAGGAGRKIGSTAHSAYAWAGDNKTKLALGGAAAVVLGGLAYAVWYQKNTADNITRQYQSQAVELAGLESVILNKCGENSQLAAEVNRLYREIKEGKISIITNTQTLTTILYGNVTDTKTNTQTVTTPHYITQPGSTVTQTLTAPGSTATIYQTVTVAGKTETLTSVKTSAVTETYSSPTTRYITTTETITLPVTMTVTNNTTQTQTQTATTEITSTTTTTVTTTPSSGAQPPVIPPPASPLPPTSSTPIIPPVSPPTPIQ